MYYKRSIHVCHVSDMLQYRKENNAQSTSINFWLVAQGFDRRQK